MPTQPEPKLREDLLVSELHSGGERSFVLKDPGSGKFFRFQQVEQFVCQQLDGETSLDQIQRRVEEKFGDPIDSETLTHFIESLRQKALLVGVDGATSEAQKTPGRVRGSLLYLRFKAVDPDKFLTWLLPKVKFFFTPLFVYASTAAILVGIALTILGWEKIHVEILQLFNFRTFLAVWAIGLVVAVGHELGHALTCRHFGGQVHEIGFMLAYLQPGMYANVTDAWLFPEKYKRLWVSFAGPYFELMVWAAAVIVWYATDPESGLHFTALVVMATSGFKTLVNFMPLIKLDGYYLLSDYLEVPNLRKKSFAYIGERLKRFSRSSSRRFKKPSSREKWILLIYGLLATVYSSSLLGLIFSNLGAVAIESFGVWGFGALSLLLFAILKRRLKKYFPRLGANFAPGEAVKSMWKLSAWRWGAGLVGVTLFFLIPIDLRIGGEFRVLPSKNADIRAQVEGLVAQIYVQEGDLVRPGDVIAQLSNLDYQAELQKTEAELAHVQAKLKLAIAGTRAEEIEVARSDVVTAKTREEQATIVYEEAKRMRFEKLAKTRSRLRKVEAQLEHARRNFATFELLLKGDLVARKEHEDARLQLAVKEIELAEAQADLQLILADNLGELQKDIAVTQKNRRQTEDKLNIFLAGSRLGEIEAIEAEAARLKAQRAYVGEQLRLVKMVSPITGTITTPVLKLKELIGQHVNKGDLIAKVNALGTITAEIVVSERDIADVIVGRDVALKARAFPDLTFTGKVVAIAATARSPSETGAASLSTVIIGGNSGRGMILVQTAINNRALLLKPDMTGKAKITAESYTLFGLLQRRFARTFGVQIWSWW